MSAFSRYKNRALAKLATGHPFFGRMLAESYSPVETKGIPWTPLNKPLSECRLALVTTAGVHNRQHIPFDMEDRQGDPSFRVIDVTRPIKDLMITHDYYNHADADKDINIVFPIERLRELESRGRIGGVAEKHYGFMGHIVGRHIQTLVNQSAPEVARRLNREAVDVVLLTPGWGICNQSVGLIQRRIEEEGIPTIGISIVRSMSEKIKPPRTVFVDQPFGHPLGEPFDRARQRTILIQTLNALFTIKRPGTILDLPG